MRKLNSSFGLKTLAMSFIFLCVLFTSCSGSSFSLHDINWEYSYELYGSVEEAGTPLDPRSALAFQLVLDDPFHELRQVRITKGLYSWNFSKFGKIQDNTLTLPSLTGSFGTEDLRGVYSIAIDYGRSGRMTREIIVDPILPERFDQIYPLLDKLSPKLRLGIPRELGKVAELEWVDPTSGIRYQQKLRVDKTLLDKL